MILHPPVGMKIVYNRDKYLWCRICGPEDIGRNPLDIWYQLHKMCIPIDGATYIYVKSMIVINDTSKPE